MKIGLEHPLYSFMIKRLFFQAFGVVFLPKVKVGREKLGQEPSLRACEELGVSQLELAS